MGRSIEMDVQGHETRWVGNKLAVHNVYVNVICAGLGDGPKISPRFTKSAERMEGDTLAMTKPPEKTKISMHRQKTPGILVNVRMPLPKTQTIRFKYGRCFCSLPTGTDMMENIIFPGKRQCVPGNFLWKAHVSKNWEMAAWFDFWNELAAPGHTTPEPKERRPAL